MDRLPGDELVDADVMAPTTRLAIEDAVYLRQPDHAAHHRAERDLRDRANAGPVGRSRSGRDHSRIAPARRQWPRLARRRTR